MAKVRVKVKVKVSGRKGVVPEREEDRVLRDKGINLRSIM